MLWLAAVLLQVQTRDVKAMTVLLDVKYSDRYMREAHYPFTELQLLNVFMLLIYFQSSRRTCVAVGQLSGSVQWIFLVLFVTGQGQRSEADKREGGARKSGWQGSATVAESNLEDQRATSFNKECSSSMSHAPRGPSQRGMWWPAL